MEGSRRPFDRSRELGVKKPRLAEEVNPNTRGLLQRPAAPPGAGLAPPRNRTAERNAERDDSGRGVGYQPQHPHQELVSQYRTALGELTFNSKPIITNLTIIAGENQGAAKAIAATICSNILEVPSDQKLPSLYLLDSIVKNIARDYIKYFAARLPEVFCKAYRQVDSSIHTAMRHLFGTWKGVFPPQPLQVIEKELGFSPAVNGSTSVAATSRPDSQSQRPPHSIHVNPKYLEARQRLQQSNRAKELTDELTASVANATEDVDRLGRTRGIVASKAWTDPPVKLHNLQRPQLGTELAHEKNIGTAYGDHKHGSGIGRAIERAADDKSRYAVGSGVSEAISSQRNGFGVKHKLSDYSASRSANADVPTQSVANRTSGLLCKNWKNSDEEEYAWDDLNPTLKDHGAASSLKKYQLTPDDPEKLDFGKHLRKQQWVNDVGSKIEMDASIDSLSTQQQDQAFFGHGKSSPWSTQEPHSMGGLSPLDNSTIISGPLEENPSAISSLTWKGLGPPHAGGSTFGLSANSPTTGQQWPNSRRNALPSGQAPMHQHPPSPSYSGHRPQLYQGLAEPDHSPGQPLPRSDFKATKILGQLNAGLHKQVAEDPVVILHQNIQIQPGNFQKIQSQSLHGSSPSLPPPQIRRQGPHSQQMQGEPMQPETSLLNHKPLLPQMSDFGSQSSINSNALPSNFPGQQDPSSLLAAVVKSGILSNNAVTGIQPKLSFQDARPISQSTVQCLATRPPSSELTSCEPKLASTPSSVPHSLDKAPASANPSLRKAERVPAPSGSLPTPTTAVSTSPQISSTGNKSANPLSNLLSSLVAKGLISSSKTESPSLALPSKPMKPENQSSDVIAASSDTVSSATCTPSIADEVSVLEPDAKSSVPSESTAVGIQNLIGFEFKPDIIRKSHPSVISDFFDDLPHQCRICGLRLRLKDRLDRHLEWHASKNPEGDSLCRASRKWYVHSSNWITGEISSGFKSIESVDGSSKVTEKNEQMVPADESQCVCIFCGEFFEDFYSQQRDEWMFKDAVCLTAPSGVNEMRLTKETTGQGPIVHAKCVSESLLRELGLANDIKMEQDG